MHPTKLLYTFLCSEDSYCIPLRSNVFTAGLLRQVPREKGTLASPSKSTIVSICRPCAAAHVVAVCSHTAGPESS